MLDSIRLLLQTTIYGGGKCSLQHRTVFCSPEISEINDPISSRAGQRVCLTKIRDIFNISPNQFGTFVATTPHVTTCNNILWQKKCGFSVVPNNSQQIITNVNV